ncbi:histidine kinase [Spongiactinospora sp. TRM90649]|uniref:sensor histidine kinase n=1 Tax=Spongiactinospora sp. TRM90649 TaxID=3031114 RepID=UPI0023F8B380|nr:histidine kinase [Spongiactinospora sp. TRM90649]MDF5756769.1 histidine kinase [Spongiactinospora sp. TRM90649]
MSTTGWVLLCLLSALVGHLLLRLWPRALPPSRCGPAPGTPYAVHALAVLHELNAATMVAPALRTGLNRHSARVTARHLRALLGGEAVAVVPADGVVAWAGAESPAGHAADALAHARSALARGRPHVAGEHGCERAACPLGGVVTVPLTVDGELVGALSAFVPAVSADFAGGVAEAGRWVSGRLELAELDTCRRRASEAEMRALRAQISPHFVYNSLTAIAGFVRTDPDRARDLLLDFADFARHALRRSRELTTLAEELGCVDRYLLLERARYGERLRFTVQVAPEALRARVPILCVQPLVENAVKHGLGGRDGVGQVRVVVSDAGPETHISVEDDGMGMDPARLRATRGGIGLANVDVRLRRIYGEDYGLQVESTLGGGTTVRLRVPKNRITHPDNGR